MSLTYNPKKRKRSKTHGYKVRKKTKGGQKVLKRRIKKGRYKISV
jgi:large subunit ribosomal protein L34